MTIEETIQKLEELKKEKELEIKNQNYERAAKIRDDIRKLTDLLEELMNPPDSDKK
jgi:ATP-dependent Clp protease ATP-binding subunit ClpC